MPCRLNADVHEGSNEVPTVPRRAPVNLHPSEQAWYFQREEKSLWRFTTQPVVAISGAVQSIVRSVEAPSLGGVNAIV